MPAIDGTDLYFGIVAARYNNALIETLVERVRKTLRESKVSEGSIKVLRVPGSGELPYVANMLAQTGEYDCIIALGVVIAGDTPHHEIIAHSTALALQGIAIQTEVPVINGIITVNNREQADERVTGKMDRGTEFAHAALEMAWHHVHLGDYLDELDSEIEAEENAAANAAMQEFMDDDEDDDTFDSDRSPFHKN